MLDIGLIVLTLICIYYCVILHKNLTKVQATKDELLATSEELKNSLKQASEILLSLQAANMQAEVHLEQLKLKAAGQRGTQLSFNTYLAQRLQHDIDEMPNKPQDYISISTSSSYYDTLKKIK